MTAGRSRSSAPSRRARASSSPWRAPTRSSRGPGRRSRMRWPGSPRVPGPTALCSSRARRASSSWGREPAARSSWRARSLGTRVPIGGFYCHGRDRADGVGRPHPVPQRHDGVGPARFHVGGRDRTSLTDEPPADPRPTSSRRRTSGSPGASSGSRPTSAGSRSSRIRTRRSQSRLLTELEEERARSRAAAAQRAAPADHRPAGGRRDADRGSSRVGQRPVQRRRRVHRDLRPPRTGGPDRAAQRALLRLRRRSASGPASRRSRPSATPIWSIGGLDGRPDHATAIAETALQMIEQVEARPRARRVAGSGSASTAGRPSPG